MRVRGIDARLERLDAALGYTRAAFRHRDGRHMYLPAGTVLGAFFRWVGGGPPNLAAEVSDFLAGSVLTTHSSDVEACLIAVCRDNYQQPGKKTVDADAPSDLPPDGEG